MKNREHNIILGVPKIATNGMYGERVFKYRHKGMERECTKNKHRCGERVYQKRHKKLYRVYQK